jgi:hypothetical protein
MRKKLLLFILISHLSTQAGGVLSSESPTTPQPAPPPTVRQPQQPTPTQPAPAQPSVINIPAGATQFVINNNNTYLPNINSSSNATSSSSNQTNVNVSTWIEMIQENKFYKDAPEYLTTFKSLLHQNRYTIATWSACISYATIATKSLYAQHFLSHRGNWCQWKKHLSAEELQEYDQQELIKNLIHDIQIKHIDPFHPTDFITPCVRFIQTIEIESKYIQQIIIIGTIATKLKRLFFMSNETLQKVKTYKQRLVCIKNLFVVWAANYNMGQAAPAKGYYQQPESPKKESRDELPS